MSINLRTSPTEILWQVVKYLLLTFVVLVIIVSAVLLFIYYRVVTWVTPDFLAAIVGTGPANILIVLGILFIPAAVITWLLARGTLRSSQLTSRIGLDEQLLDIATDSIFVHDLNGTCIYDNELAEKFRSSVSGDFTGKDTESQRALEFTELIEPRIDELTENGEITFESEYVRGDSTSVPVEIHSRLFGVRGKNLVLSTVRDITDRKRTEEELRQSSEKLRKAMEGTINSMSSTAEVRDPYTAGHQQRVAKLAVAIAQELGLPAEQIEGIRIAGTLHDMGKIYVPAEILSKPGQLRQTEFNLIKDHAEVGYDMLKNIEFPWQVAQIVLQHHERLDGSGYPKGLSGDMIMLEARIMAVSDVVESMSSHRPYRPAFSVEKALLEIIHKKGTLYDPAVVDACVTLFNDKGFTF